MKTGLRCAQRGVATVQNAIAGFILNAIGGYLDFLRELKDIFSIRMCYPTLYIDHACVHHHGYCI